MTNRASLGLATWVLLLTGAATCDRARADVVHLRNGRTLQGKVTYVSPQGPERSIDLRPLRVSVPGGSIVVRNKDVLRIERSRARPVKTVLKPKPKLARHTSLLKQLSRSLEAAYQAGEPGLARKLLEAEPRALAWYEASEAITLSGRYVTTRSGGEVELQVALRSRVVGPLLVAFPPGALGLAPEPAADVAFLRAPVVLLEAGKPRRLRVPAAWIELGKAAPKAGQVLTLVRARRSTERLLGTLCSAQAKAGDETAAQLALWIEACDVVPSALTRGTRISCTSRKLVLPLHRQRAEALLRAGGIATQRLPFFRALQRASGLPELPAKPAPQSSPTTPRVRHPTPRKAPSQTGENTSCSS